MIKTQNKWRRVNANLDYFRCPFICDWFQDKGNQLWPESRQNKGQKLLQIYIWNILNIYQLFLLFVVFMCFSKILCPNLVVDIEMLLSLSHVAVPWVVMYFKDNTKGLWALVTKLSYITTCQRFSHNSRSMSCRSAVPKKPRRTR